MAQVIEAVQPFNPSLFPSLPLCRTRAQVELFLTTEKLSLMSCGV